MPQNDEGARTGASLGREEAVDQRQSVRQPVAQCDAVEVAVRAPEVDEEGIDRRILDHRPILLEVHVRHPAAGVARGLIAAEQAEMRRTREGGHLARHDRRVPRQHPAHRAAGAEAAGAHANRAAGGATVALRPIDDPVTAPEPGVRKLLVKRVRRRLVEHGEQLSLEPAGKIRTRERRRSIEHMDLGVHHQRP